MVEVPMLETLAAFNSIEMFGGLAFVPPIGPSGYNRMKARKPVRTKDGWLTMLPYSGDNWCAFFEAVGRPECIEEFQVRDPVQRARNIDRIYDRMREIAQAVRVGAQAYLRRQYLGGSLFFAAVFVILLLEEDEPDPAMVFCLDDLGGRNIETIVLHRRTADSNTGGNHEHD